jgi:predicted nuclease of restriction endonuclease-like (RecB) superfamily
MKQNEQFSEVIEMIKQARERALRAVNKEMIDLYWYIGEYVSKKVEAEEWGKSVVLKLAEHISKTEPDLKGFSDKNLWRMKQFFETYQDLPKLSPLVREISWTNNLIILSGAKSPEEKEFYIRLCIKEAYGKRELERQIASGIFERVMIGNQKLSPLVRELGSDIIYSLKDSYIFDFLNLPENHNERQLQKGLINKMKDFILELGKDFSFVGEEYRLQVGNSDFWIDLLFFHRGLQSLVAIELKAEKFTPEFLGQLNFYIEALNRDVKKRNENPSIGILLCRYKDDEVVEYALSSSMSPALVAAYQTQLPDKKLLKQKLHELFVKDNGT